MRIALPTAIADLERETTLAFVGTTAREYNGGRRSHMAPECAVVMPFDELQKRLGGLVEIVGETDCGLYEGWKVWAAEYGIEAHLSTRRLSVDAFAEVGEAE